MQITDPSRPVLLFSASLIVLFSIGVTGCGKKPTVEVNLAPAQNVVESAAPQKQPFMTASKTAVAKHEGFFTEPSSSLGIVPTAEDPSNQAGNDDPALDD